VASVVLFRRLAFTTALFVYLQIALGSVVRVSGSGLGCPDWPLCQGRPYPPANVHSIIEYSHRTVGFVTGLLVLATVVIAWVVFRNRRPVVTWLATAFVLAYGSEGVLGGVVVVHQLPPWIVLVHLGLAMIIIGLALATAVMSLPETPGLHDPVFRRWAAVAVGATYVMLLTGSTVVASSADQRCNSWPLCGSGLTPSFAGVDAFTMLHRGTVLVVGILIVVVLISALRQPALRRVAIAGLVVFALQVAVGAAAAITDAAFFSGVHIAVATLVWVGVLGTALLTLSRVDRSEPLSLLAVEKRTA
jgi:heme A synthase